MLKHLTAAIPVAALVACSSAPTPSETVDRLVEAVRSGDSTEVARYIDIKRVAESAVDPLFQAAAMMETNDPDGFREQTGGMGVEMLEQFRPMIAPMMEQVFWQMMLDPESLQQGPIGQIIGDRPLPIAELGDAYQGVVDERRDGEDAIVSVELASDPGDRNIVIDMRLEENEQGWKVVSFDNLQETIGNLMDNAN